MSGVKGPVRQKPESAQSHLKSSPARESDHEGVTTNEIEIKLDLARQFLDMGDPESARHMLDEVLNEGDPSERQEALRLLESLP